MLNNVSSGLFSRKTIPGKPSYFISLLAISLFFGSVVAFSPALGLIVAGGFIGTAIAYIKPSLIIHSAWILATIALPNFVPMQFSVAGLSLYVYEPFLVVSAVYVAFRYSAPTYANLRVLALFLLVVVWVLVGVLQSNNYVAILRDTRMLIYCLLAFFIGSRLLGTYIFDEARKLLPFVFGLSAVVTLGAAFFGYGLSGMLEDIAGGTRTVSRLVSPATYPAVAILCFLMARYLVGTRHAKGHMVLILSCLTIAFFSFTRNSVLTIVVATMFVLICVRSSRAILRSLRIVLALTVSIATVYGILSIMGAESVLAWLRDQGGYFFERVIVGLSPDTIAADGSAQYRLTQENSYLYHAIEEAPLFGHGYGYAYRPLFTGRFITENSEVLRYYAHNFYLWMGAKSGLAGSLLFAYAFIAPLLGILSRSRSEQVVVGAVTAGLLAASVVAPMPLGSPTAVLIGLLGGMTASAVGKYRNVHLPARKTRVSS